MNFLYNASRHPHDFRIGRRRQPLKTNPLSDLHRDSSITRLWKWRLRFIAPPKRYKSHTAALPFIHDIAEPGAAMRRILNEYVENVLTSLES
jgi:hypothetical protein